MIVNVLFDGDVDEDLFYSDEFLFFLLRNGEYVLIRDNVVF